MKSPYDSITFGNPLSLRVDSKYMSIITIAPCGRDVVLAGRKGLLVIDLDDPFAAPRWLHHETSWEVADVQWSPHPSKPSWVVSTSNQKALVWNLARSSNDAIEHVLHSHTRAITDIHFHPQNPEMLATCSVDSFVLAWDLRCPKEPVMKWADWRDAASQVKWNYKDSNILASSHDNILHIWDVRKGAIPTKSFEAHDAKINSLDWSRESKFELISASNDMSVKFWSFNKEYDKPIYTIKTDFPVSKARHVPFGDHVCGIMPLRGGNNSVYVVDYKNKIGEAGLAPIYTFKGHTEPVKDFVWRSRRTYDSTVDDSEYQLVTWASDRDLRLWPMNDQMYSSFNYKKGMPLPEGKVYPRFEYKSYRVEPLIEVENKLIIRNQRKIGESVLYGIQKFNSEFNHLNWISGIKIGQSAFQGISSDPNSATFGDSSNQPLNLGEEFSNVGHKFPKLRFERISVSTGVLVLSLSGPWSAENKDDLIFIRLEINFPAGYPSSESVPKFKVENTHDLQPEKKKEILDNLSEIATKYCEHERFCLEPCLRFLLGEKIDLDLDFADSMVSYDLDFKNNNDLHSLNTTITDIDQSEEEEDEEEDNDDDEVNVLLNDGVVNPDGTEHKPMKRTQFDSTPVSKGCGAIWTNSGHLVCFFMKQNADDDDHLIKFGQQGFSLVRNLKRKKVENGMQIDRNRHNLGNVSNVEYSSESDSSTDSLSNDFDLFQYDRMYRTKVPDLLKNSTGKPFSNNARSNIMSAPTDRSHGTENSKSTRSKNIVKIYDFRHLIPVKMELACEYRIMGDNPHVLADHNALVAEKYGYKTVAHCWKMLAAILVKDVTIDQETATRLLEKLGRDTSNIEVTNCYRFFWGYHPFGARWFVVEIFNYFKKLGDVQMLAMMSCILFENNDIKNDTSIPINSPFSARVSSSDAKRSISRGQQRVDDDINRSYSIMAPPILARNHSSVSFERKYSRSVMNSFNPSSPINLLQTRVPSVSTMSSFEYDNRSFKSASPAADLFFGTLIPQNKRGIKHSGPVVVDYSSYTDSVSSSQNRSTTCQMTATQLQIVNKTNHSFAKDEENVEAPKVVINMINSSDLDLYTDEHCVNIEAFVLEQDLKNYRSEYASILFSWGLPESRLKVLKFNYANNRKNTGDFIEHCGAIGWYNDINIKVSDPSCIKWEKAHKKSKCNFCQLAVKKRLSVCSKCNHLMHDTCALIWWVDNEMRECPTGCGCDCLH